MTEFNKYEFFSYNEENDYYIDGELKNAYYNANSHIILQQNSKLLIDTDVTEEITRENDYTEEYENSYNNIMLYVEENCLPLLDRCSLYNFITFLEDKSKL